MIKRFFSREIPLYAVVVFLALISTVIALTVFQVRDVVYNYSINLPSTTNDQSFNYGSWPALNDAGFYDKVFNDLVAQKATFISANLSTMRLKYYKDGVLADEAAILAKGKVGSWWETPAGLYKVLSKVPSDFSSFAHVYSPWALDFQGNFLIHGWPYYPDGTPVGSTYSGGCIRLSTDDAKKLYGMVGVGTPVLVSSDNFKTDSFYERIQDPPIAATSYLAADLKSNFVFAEKDPDKQVPIASLTKLMTALVAVEYINIESTITITPEMIVKTSIPRLKVGQQLSLYDLLQPLLKESSNEAAVAISHFLGPKYFVNLMNQTAKSVGMQNTHFTDPSGSDWSDVSTAHDLFILAQYLYDNRIFILKMTTNKNEKNVYGPSAFPTLQNFNVFADDPDFIGGKVGINGGASDTILSVFEGQFSVGAEVPAVIAPEASTTPDANPSSTAPTLARRPFMFVILGSNDFITDAKDFLAWIKATYR